MPAKQLIWQAADTLLVLGLGLIGLRVFECTEYAIAPSVFATLTLKRLTGALMEGTGHITY
ncbi:MAG: hypothetical protein KQH53_15175 [Desulfarculaceae bacterium]|nr:hypothetical protein [Desulfarculaceae bacterium]